MDANPSLGSPDIIDSASTHELQKRHDHNVGSSGKRAEKSSVMKRREE